MAATRRGGGDVVVGLRAGSVGVLGARSVGVLGAAVVVVAGLVYFAFFRGGTVYVLGTRAGDLDAGSVIGQGFGVRRPGAFTVSAIEVENKGHAPILIESVVPQSTSSGLRATPARIWVIPREAYTAKVKTHYVNSPNGSGWPPKHIFPKPQNVPSLAWTSPPPVLLLPTKEWVDPGRYAELIYGVFFHARPSPRLRITALRITFKQGDQTFVWTLPNTASFHLRH